MFTLSVESYLPQEPGDLVAVLPGGDPATARVAVYASAAVVERLAAAQVVAEHVRLLAQQLVERLHEDVHCVVHECRLCLQDQRTLI